MQISFNLSLAKDDPRQTKSIQVLFVFRQKLFIKVYNNFNKTAQIMDMHPYAGSFAESLNFGDEDTPSQQSSYRVNVLSFKQIPRCASRQFSDFGDLSMDDSVHHEHQKPDIKAYKCFKCYGINKNGNIESRHKKCRQCSGSEYITQHHPLVAIMEQIIKKKMPNLSNKVEEYKKFQNKRETLQLQYGCKEVIKEQSFSYQQQSPPFCRNCNRQCDQNCYRICQKCVDFNICEYCFQKKRYSHHHPLIMKDTSRMPSRISQALSNMKKISQQIDSSQSQNYLEQLQFICSNCKQAIDICYDACATCQARGTRYYVCNNCSQFQLYSHDPSHTLVMRTITQISQLNRLQSAQSQDENLQLDSIANPNSNIDTQRSIVRFNHELINQSFEGSQHIDFPFGKDSQINFNFSDHLFEQLPTTRNKLSSTYNDGQFDKIIRKKMFQSVHSIDSSLNGIDLSSSLQIKRQSHSQLQKQKPPLEFVPIFNVDTHQTLYKTRTNPQEEYIFNDYQCDICGVQPIKNKRFHCSQCQNFDLCQECYLIRSKKHQHRNFQQIDGRQLLKQRNSIIQLNQSKQLFINHMKIKNGAQLNKTLK